MFLNNFAPFALRGKSLNFIERSEKIDSEGYILDMEINYKFIASQPENKKALLDFLVEIGLKIRRVGKKLQ